MGWLDNSGDVILDAVITDAGRARMAQGQFKISKFAVGDDEINYQLYEKNHDSGSAFYDLQILQTPVLEAFTNNTSIMKSKLISIPRTNLLYLPTIKINEVFASSFKMHASSSFMLAVDSNTEDSFSQLQGFIPGETLNGGAIIRLDQGLDTTEIPPTFNLDADLIETQYIIEIDNRLGKIVSPNGTAAKVSYIDDDNVASYYLSLGTDTEFVSENTERNVRTTETIAGPRGTILQFQVQSSLDVNTSTFLFSKLGSTAQIVNQNNLSVSVQYIDTTIRVTGATTGRSIDVPLRLIKL